MSTARKNILARVRDSLRRDGSPPNAVPEARVRLGTNEDKVQRFRAAVEALAGKTVIVRDKADARGYVQSVVGDRLAVSSPSGLLHECGIDYGQDDVSNAQVGVTSAEYALADTGTLVVMSVTEPRLFSLLPPVHVAIIEAVQILSGLDELLTILPRPADLGASLVLITGPSRTADIEQILVRGVHGPGELHVVIVE